MDHMSGRDPLFWQDEVPLANFWDIAHTKDWDKETFDESRFQWNDVLVYRRMRNSYIQDDNEHKVIDNLQGSEGAHWSSHGVTVLGPDQELITACNSGGKWNNASYVLAVDYGGRRVILGGDAEQASWNSVEKYAAGNLKCDVLKAAHHGRFSGYSESATTAMDPAIVICSVGKKPATDASDEYRAHGADVLSTRYHGSIIVRVWADGEIWALDHNREKVCTVPPL